MISLTDLCRVRPLEWVEMDRGLLIGKVLIAKSVLGSFTVYPTAESRSRPILIGPNVCEGANTVEECQSQALAHYLKAIEPMLIKEFQP